MSKRDKILPWFKYPLAIYAVVSGLATSFRVPVPLEGLFGLLYGSRPVLIISGIIITISGLILMYGRFKRRRKIVGLGLMLIYISFLYTGTLNLLTDQIFIYYVTDFMAAALAAGLWIYWRFRTEYIQPRYFRADLIEIQRDMNERD